MFVALHTIPVPSVPLIPPVPPISSRRRTGGQRHPVHLLLPHIPSSLDRQVGCGGVLPMEYLHPQVGISYWRTKAGGRVAKNPRASLGSADPSLVFLSYHACVLAQCTTTFLASPLILQHILTGQLCNKPKSDKLTYDGDRWRSTLHI